MRCWLYCVVAARRQVVETGGCSPLEMEGRTKMNQHVLHISNVFCRVYGCQKTSLMAVDCHAHHFSADTISTRVEAPMQ